MAQPVVGAEPEERSKAYLSSFQKPSTSLLVKPAAWELESMAASMEAEPREATLEQKAPEAVRQTYALANLFSHESSWLVVAEVVAARPGVMAVTEANYLPLTVDRAKHLAEGAEAQVPVVLQEQAMAVTSKARSVSLAKEEPEGFRPLPVVAEAGEVGMAVAVAALTTTPAALMAVAVGEVRPTQAPITSQTSRMKRG